MKSIPFVSSCFNVIFHGSLNCLEKFADRNDVFMNADTLHSLRAIMRTIIGTADLSFNDGRIERDT